MRAGRLNDAGYLSSSEVHSVYQRFKGSSRNVKDPNPLSMKAGGIW